MSGSLRAAPRASLLRLARLWLPVSVTVVALLMALQVPRATGHGRIPAEPGGLTAFKSVALDYRPAVSWGPHHRRIVLVVHPRGRCRVHIRSITSTAPGRIEVRTTETGHCVGDRTVERFTLPLPIVKDPRGNVRVDVGPAVLRLRGSAMPPSPDAVSS